MFNTLTSAFDRLLVMLLASSFWMSRISSTKIPTKATEPASAEVAMVETVDVVTVEIITDLIPETVSMKYNQ